jgi:hypothetical protein
MFPQSLVLRHGNTAPFLYTRDNHSVIRRYKVLLTVSMRRDISQFSITKASNIARGEGDRPSKETAAVFGETQPCGPAKDVSP